MADDAVRAALPQTADAYDAWSKIVVDLNNDVPSEEDPADFVYTGLYNDLMDGSSVASMPSVDVTAWEPVSLREQFIDANDGWADPAVWSTIKTYGGDYTSGYFLNSVDMQLSGEGVTQRPEDERIYITLFVRTIILSIVITGSCILLGYPIAFLLGKPATAERERSDDPRSAAILDLASGADLGLESFAAEPRRDQRYPRLAARHR
jgi:putative spermidine/putrescine transport system permease protein